MMVRLGWLLFVVLGARWAFLYGREWDFGGPLCLPRTLLAPDGRHYPDGTPLDPVTQAIVASGHEAEITACLLLFIAALFLLCFQMCQDAARLRQRHEELKAALQEVRR